MHLIDINVSIFIIPSEDAVNLVFFFFFFNLFLAVLGLCFCARAFSSCGKRGSLFIVVCGPLTIAASLIAGRRLQTRRLSNCDSRAQPLHGMWDLPRPGLEPVSPALAGRFSTTVPPGKPRESGLIKGVSSGKAGERILTLLILPGPQESMTQEYLACGADLVPFHWAAR